MAFEQLTARITFFLIALLCSPAQASDAVLVGAWHFDAWDGDCGVWIDGASSGQNSIFADERRSICLANQAWFDTHPVATISVGAGDCTCDPADCTHAFIQQLEQRQFLFDIGPVDPGWTWSELVAYCDELTAAEPHFNYWTRVKQSAVFKRTRAAEFGWPDNLVIHEPLSIENGYLGYYDDADVAIATRQIQTAADWGVDFFVFELHFNLVNNHILSNTLATIQAFLQSPNRNRMRFAFMWEVADWEPTGGAVDFSDAALDRYVDFWVAHYFNQPNYLRIEGKPVLYIYLIDEMASSLGSQSAVQAAFARLRSRLQNQHGFAGLYVVAIDPSVQAGSDYVSMGIDAVTKYSESRWAQDQTYAASIPAVVDRWQTGRGQMNSLIPYQPAVHTTVTDFGWSFGSILYTGIAGLNACGLTPPGQDIPGRLDATGPNPDNFAALLGHAKAFIQSDAAGNRALVINAWNEWGEGGIIQPTEAYGYGHLQKIRDVFGANPVVDWGLENGTPDIWTTWNSNPGDFSIVNCPRDKACTGLKTGQLASSNQAYQFVYQAIEPPSFTAGRAYTAWAKIMTRQVLGNGARLRVGFRDSDNAIIRVDESTPQSGTSADFNLHVIAGQTIPVGTQRVLVQICGSSDQGSGPDAVIQFDDVHFKASLGVDEGPCSHHAECTNHCCLEGVCSPSSEDCESDGGIPDAGGTDDEFLDAGDGEDGLNDAGLSDGEDGADNGSADVLDEDGATHDAADALDAGLPDAHSDDGGHDAGTTDDETSSPDASDPAPSDDSSPAASSGCGCQASDPAGASVFCVLPFACWLWFRRRTSPATRPGFSRTAHA